MVALSAAGASVTCAAPNKDQMHVINHASGAEMSETRNVMIESARISRGNIADLSTVNPDDFDAVFLPGGFGAAKNLCTFATEGSDCSIDGDTQRILKAFHAAGKPPNLAPQSLELVSPILGQDRLHGDGQGDGVGDGVAGGTVGQLGESGAGG